MDNNSGIRTTVLDLPDELLDQILAEVKWGAPAPTFELDVLQFYENLTCNTDTASIQRVRLTCRRLASRASALLLPVASVSISDPSSVDSLEQIASHGRFAPHVKAVHVHFDFYEAELAADIRKLAAHLLESGKKLIQETSSAEANTELSLPGGKTRAEWVHILRHWGAFCHGKEGSGVEEFPSISSGPAAESMGLLRREHAEYRRRYESQQRLARSVVERISKAMARMPRATRLILEDGPDTPTPPSIDSPRRNGEWLATPTTWAAAFKLGRSSPPLETMFALLAALYRAGVGLTGLRIHRLRVPSEFPRWPLLEEQEETLWKSRHRQNGDDRLPREVEELRAACSTLRVLEFTPGYEPDSWYPGSPTFLGWPGLLTYSGPRSLLSEVLEWVLASRSLRQVWVDLHVVDNGLTYELAMPLPPWPHIQVLHLRDSNVEVATLSSFLSASAGTLTRLHLDGMRLCSRSVGFFPSNRAPFSWASVLDSLRAHCRRLGERTGSGDGGDDCTTRLRGATTAQEPLIIRISRPDGAEFEDRSLSKTDLAHLKALFEPDDDNGSGLSAVDAFIQGLSDRNPLVEAGKTPFLYP